MKKQKTDRTGEEGYNNQGLKMKIIKYNNVRNIDVIFENGWIAKNRQYTSFKKGAIKNPYHPEVYGVGFTGEGKYKPRENEKAMSKRYKVWFAMLLRCYGTNNETNTPTYVDCEVCEEWKNFNKFCEWFDDNYYELGNEKIQLDKDILIKGNKVYSPEACIFVPQKINTLILKTQGKRGLFPIGVTYYKKNKKYGAQCCHSGKRKDKYLGLFDTPEEAFEAYKQEKESYIKKVADEYKAKYPQFPQKLYDALYNYVVEITD